MRRPTPYIVRRCRCASNYGAAVLHLCCDCGWMSEPIDGDTDDEIQSLSHEHQREAHPGGVLVR